jgi:hypothetical protein
VRRTIREAVSELEREWATLLGTRRFATLKQLLHELYDAQVQTGPPVQILDKKRRASQRGAPSQKRNL